MSTSILNSEYVHRMIERIAAAGKDYFYLAEFGVRDVHLNDFGDCLELMISYRGHRYYRVLDEGDMITLGRDFDEYSSFIFQGMIYGLANIVFRQPFSE